MFTKLAQEHSGREQWCVHPHEQVTQTVRTKAATLVLEQESAAGKWTGGQSGANSGFLDISFAYGPAAPKGGSTRQIARQHALPHPSKRTQARDSRLALGFS